MPHTSRRFLVLYNIIAILSWSSAYPVVRLAMRDIPPIPLAALRYALAALLAGMWLLYKRPSWPAWRDMPRLVVCGVSGIALYNIFFNIGEQTVPSGTTSLLIAAAPIMAGLLAVCFAGESLGLWGWLGSLLSFGGVALIVTGRQGSVSLDNGAFMILAAALCAAIYMVLQRPLVQRYGGMLVTAYMLIVGAVLLLPWLVQGVRLLPKAPMRAWICVVELGIFPAALGYAAWSGVIGALGAARGALFLYFLPPITFLLAFWLEGAWPDTFTLLGGAVVMLGVCIAQYFGQRRARS